MNLNQRIREALAGICGVIVPQVHTGDATEYIVFNYNSYPADFGDDAPGHEVYSVQVHLFCPSGVNSLSMRREIKAALAAAGFTWPEYINASGKGGQHHVFECQTAQAPEVE